MVDKLYAINAQPTLQDIHDIQRSLVALDTQILPEAEQTAHAIMKPVEDRQFPLGWNPVLASADHRELVMQLHRPFLLRAMADKRLLANRKALIAAARGILVFYRSLAHCNRGQHQLDLTFMTLNALIVLAIDLYGMSSPIQYESALPYLYQVIHEDDREAALESLYACCTLLSNAAQVHAPVQLALNAISQLVQSAVRRFEVVSDDIEVKRPRLDPDRKSVV